MSDLGAFVGRWGYLGIFLVVLLGNAGLPVPEETVLALGGYLVWRGTLRLPLVLLVGVLSAVTADNVGYWVGRRYGREVVARHGPRLGITPARVQRVEELMGRRGPLVVFAARFVPGFRFLVAPLAGATGLGPVPFAAANLLGATCYVPYAVALGYLVGLGFGGYLEGIRRTLGEVEHLALLALSLYAAGRLAWRLARAGWRRPRGH